MIRMTRTAKYRRTRKARLVRNLTRRLGQRYVNEYRGPAGVKAGRVAVTIAA